MLKISKEDYKLICQVLRGSSGLDLGENKEYLVINRIVPILPVLKLNSLQDLVHELRKPNRDEKLIRTISESMLTYESLFFRDKRPFEILVEKLIPQILKNSATRHIRIWSAACSFGQEPYSIAMAIEENKFETEAFSFEIVATDFSNLALERARQGKYSKSELSRGLSEVQIQRHFNFLNADIFEIDVNLKKRIHFRELNFMQPFEHIGLVDIIFCRNVLIYFSLENKRDILDRMSPQIRGDGYLILGNMESVHGITTSFATANYSQTQVFGKVGVPNKISEQRLS